MAKRVFSMIWRSVAAGSSNRVGSSPSAMTGKSSRGSVWRLKRARPALTCILPSAAASSTWLPSGSLRTISKKVWAGTVVAPAWVTLAGTLSSTWRSRSVAISRREPSSRASINTLERMGMVLRRSTTDWTWPRLFRRVARSIVAFIVQSPLIHARHASFIASRSARGSGMIGREGAYPALAGFIADRGRLGLSLAGHQHRIDMVDDAVGELVVGLGDGRLVPGGIGKDDLVAVLGRGQRSAAHRRQDRLALAGVDRLADIGRQNGSGQDEVGQHAGQLSAVFRSGVESSGGRGGER